MTTTETLLYRKSTCLTLEACGSRSCRQSHQQHAFTPTRAKTGCTYKVVTHQSCCIRVVHILFASRMLRLGTLCDECGAAAGRRHRGAECLEATYPIRQKSLSSSAKIGKVRRFYVRWLRDGPLRTPEKSKSTLLRPLYSDDPGSLWRVANGTYRVQRQLRLRYST